MFNNELDKLNKKPIVLNPNITDIPINVIPLNIEGIEKFNRIYFYLTEYCKDFHSIQWTAKHYIKRGRKIRLPQWDVTQRKNGVEITVLCIEGMFRIHLKTGQLKNEDAKTISGGTAFKCFKSICKKHNIELEDFAIDNGEEVKKSINKAPVMFGKPYYENMIFEHVYHLDLNSSFMAGIAKEYSELKAPINEIYNKRKENDIYKKVLTNSWGYFQSEYVNYRFSQLSKAGIDYNNKMLEQITKKLINQGFIIISYNTDGIWYTHPDNKIYHDDNEGIQLGQWKHDHKDCKFQAKSPRSYHFIENGEHHVVISGITRLDAQKPRTEWTWEEFNSSNAEVVKIIFNKEIGARIE